MAKLRHLAIVVKDLEASCRFYEKCFDMKRALSAAPHAVYLTDGLMNSRGAELCLGQPAGLTDGGWPARHPSFRLPG